MRFVRTIMGLLTFGIPSLSLFLTSGGNNPIDLMSRGFADILFIITIAAVISGFLIDLYEDRKEKYWRKSQE